MKTRRNLLDCWLKKLLVLAWSAGVAAPIIAATADLSLQVSASPSPAVIGGNVTFTYQVSNLGPDTATGIILTNPLPPSVIFTSAHLTDGASYAISNGLFCYWLDSLATSSTITVQLVVTPVSLQVLTNRVSVVASETDPWTWNNVDQWKLVPVLSVAPGANLNMTREYHTATLLTDGRVLVTGGDIWFSRSNRITATTELYDPTAETFQFGPTMTVPRFWHTATLLPNGQVLVVGGRSAYSNDEPDSAPVASVELYDPVKNEFIPTNHLTFARSQHTATLLPDGRVLLVGGKGADTHAEYYSPQTGTISPAGSTLTPRWGHWAALLPNGKVLIVGGYNVYPPAEVFDPEIGSSRAVPLATNDFIAGAITLISGKVLVFGYTWTAQIYDPERDEFSLTERPVSMRSTPGMTLLNDGRVLISGGGSGLGYLQSTEIYDPATGAFSAGSPMTEPREDHTATRLQDGRVLLAAGWNGHALSTSEIYADKVDKDQDGMDDAWELKYGFNPADRTDALQDADGDGHTNLQEYLAGTDPRDPHSVLRIETFQISSNVCRIRFTSVLGKLYRVERTSEFAAQNWLAVSSNIVGTGTMLEVLDTVTSANSKQWYRVSVLR
jgi:uncharacterized repeat protein (TIGR01451 family)